MEVPVAFRLLRLGCRARGWRKTWRPTFHLSTAGSNQRNCRTDRLVTSNWIMCSAATNRDSSIRQRLDLRAKEDLSNLSLNNQLIFGLEKRSGPGKHYLRGESLLPPEPSTRYTLWAYRGVRFSNPPRQPEAKRCLCDGAEACAPSLALRTG